MCVCRSLTLCQDRSWINFDVAAPNVDFVQNVPSMKRVLQRQQRKQQQQQQQQQQQGSGGGGGGGEFDDNEEEDEDGDDRSNGAVSLNREFKLRMKNAREAPSSSSSSSSSSSTSSTTANKMSRGMGACDVLISYRSDDRSGTFGSEMKRP